MDGDASLCAQNVMRLNGFLGTHVHRRHEPARFVGADGQECEIWLAELFANLDEVISEPRVPSEVHPTFWIFDYISAPQSFVAVENGTG